MRTTEIKCDGCGGDLTDAGAMPTFRLALEAESVRNSGGIIFDVAVRPEIKRPHHFCDLACLDRWRDRENHLAKLWRDWWDDWKEKNGRKDETGRVRSFPSPPQEETAAATARLEAAALSAFPMGKPKRGSA